jgi:hypothetical protein
MNSLKLQAVQAAHLNNAVFDSESFADLASAQAAAPDHRAGKALPPVINGIGAAQQFCAVVASIFPGTSIPQLEHAASLIIAMQHVLHCAGSGKLAHLNVHDRSSRSAKIRWL